jgi:hypothetical protein
MLATTRSLCGYGAAAVAALPKERARPLTRLLPQADKLDAVRFPARRATQPFAGAAGGVHTRAAAGGALQARRALPPRLGPIRAPLFPLLYTRAAPHGADTCCASQADCCTEPKEVFDFMEVRRAERARLQTSLLTRAPARAPAPRHRARVCALLRGESRVPGAEGQLPEVRGGVRRGPVQVCELRTKQHGCRMGILTHSCPTCVVATGARSRCSGCKPSLLVSRPGW